MKLNTNLGEFQRAVLALKKFNENQSFRNFTLLICMANDLYNDIDLFEMSMEENRDFFINKFLPDIEETTKLVS